jgi:hypothetical protein
VNSLSVLKQYDAKPATVCFRNGLPQPDATVTLYRPMIGLDYGAFDPPIGMMRRSGRSRIARK